MEIGPLSAYLPMNHYHALVTGHSRPVRAEGPILSVDYSQPNDMVVPFAIPAIEPADERQVQRPHVPVGMGVGPREMVMGPATSFLVS